MLNDIHKRTRAVTKGSFEEPSPKSIKIKGWTCPIGPSKTRTFKNNPTLRPLPGKMDIGRSSEQTVPALLDQIYCFDYSRTGSTFVAPARAWTLRLITRGDTRSPDSHFHIEPLPWVLLRIDNFVENRMILLASVRDCAHYSMRPNVPIEFRLFRLAQYLMGKLQFG